MVVVVMVVVVAAFIVGCVAHFAAYKWQIWVDPDHKRLTTPHSKKSK